MPNIPVQTLRTSLTIRFVFETPLFGWDTAQVSSRFFRMIHDCLSPRIAVRPGDLSVRGGTNLGELQARYSLFGGASSVSIQADGMTLDFPTLSRGEYDIARDIVRSTHDALPRALPECTYNMVEVAEYDHLQLPPEIEVSGYLDKFRVATVDVPFAKTVVVHPGARFDVISSDQSWSCSFGMERSALNATSVFVSRRIVLSATGPHVPFEEKVARVAAAAGGCLSLIGLETVNAA